MPKVTLEVYEKDIPSYPEMAVFANLGTCVHPNELENVLAQCAIKKDQRHYGQRQKDVWWYGVSVGNKKWFNPLNTELNPICQ